MDEVRLRGVATTTHPNYVTSSKDVGAVEHVRETAEHLIDIVVGVPLRKKAQLHFGEDVRLDQPMTESKYVPANKSHKLHDRN